MNKLLLAFILLSISTISQSESLKIASWNIAWLGSHGFNKRVDDDYGQLAKYASKLDADVIALQEVEDGQWANKVFGDKYDYYFTTKNWVQKVGLAVRKSSGYKVISVEYKALDVGRVRYGLDLTLTKGDKKLRLLAVHLKSGCFAKALDNNSVHLMPETSKRKSKEKNACTKLSRQMKPLEMWIDQRAKEDYRI